ncbi:MAG: hypothetical protein J0I20_26390 [Chloroflexi bacterium]|nr:hypothetical protein [Chloroflexota bacterium]OJV91889.1 MAG: hypothetical protein BGO39_14275 [Chloroflexi bacterium 54-19]
MPSHLQPASPSILLVTNGSKQASRCIENALHIAKTTGYRLVITGCSETDTITGSWSEEAAIEPRLANLVQAARQEGIEEVVTYEQDCWGEDEFDDLIRLENSQCTILAV